MNEHYFENIDTIEQLIDAERNGFFLSFKTNRPEMPGATLLHESARKCNLDLVNYLIQERNLDFNQLDDDDSSPLGYILNDDLLYEIKSRDITTVNCGCDDVFKIIKTVEAFKTLGASCVYNGASYDDEWINKYVEELKKIENAEYNELDNDLIALKEYAENGPFFFSFDFSISYELLKNDKDYILNIFKVWPHYLVDYNILYHIAPMELMKSKVTFEALK